MTLNATRLQETLTHAEVVDPKQALWLEIQTSLTRAVDLCRTVALDALGKNDVAWRIIPPRRDPDLTRQVTALLGVDRFRQLIEEDTGVQFLLAACCDIVAAPTREQALAWLTWERQFELQTNTDFMC